MRFLIQSIRLCLQIRELRPLAFRVIESWVLILAILLILQGIFFFLPSMAQYDLFLSVASWRDDLCFSYTCRTSLSVLCRASLMTTNLFRLSLSQKFLFFSLHQGHQLCCMQHPGLAVVIFQNLKHIISRPSSLQTSS